MKKGNNVDKLVAFNLGYIKVIGKETKRTKKEIKLKDVLEIQLSPREGKVIIQPIDFPLNTYELPEYTVINYMLEYGENLVKGVEPQYNKILNYIYTGVNLDDLKKGEYIIN
jgi:hypothetical protein